MLRGVCPVSNHLSYSASARITHVARLQVMECKKFETQRLNELRSLKHGKARVRAALVVDPETGTSPLHHAVAVGFANAEEGMRLMDERLRAQRATHFGRMSHRAQLIVHAERFEALIAAAIFGVAVLEVLDVDEIGDPLGRTVANGAILALFTFEARLLSRHLCRPRSSSVHYAARAAQIALKVVAERGIARYLIDHWNRFDVFVVALSYIDLIVPLGSVKALRLLRMLRVVRLLHSFPALRAVAQALVVAFANVVCVTRAPRRSYTFRDKSRDTPSRGFTPPHALRSATFSCSSCSSTL